MLKTRKYASSNIDDELRDSKILLKGTNTRCASIKQFSLKQTKLPLCKIEEVLY